MTTWRARAFVEQGDMKKADIELRNALKLDPRLAEAHYLRALVFESRKAFPEMYRELQNTVQIDENHLDAHLKLAQLHVAAGKPDEAQASVDRARAIAAGDYRVLRAQAMVHAREQRVEEALQEIREALALQPGDLDSQVMLGSLLLSSRDHEGAAQAIADGLAKHPESDALMLLDFQQHATQKRVDEAVQAMNRLIVQKPQELSYRQGLAAYLVSNERAAEAESVLRAAVAEMPQSLEAKLALVGLLAQRDQGAAVEALRGYIGQDGEGAARLRIALGELHERQSELDDAAAVYREVAASPEKEESLFARNQLARIALRQGKGDEAVALIEEILAGDSGNAEALLTRAGLRLGERRTEEAITDLRKVLGQDPSSVRAHVLLSRAHLQNGAVEMARASLVDALKIDPRNESAVTQFAGLLIGEQRYDKALEVLQPLASAPDASKRVRALELQAKLAMKDWEGANAIAGDLGERAGNPDYAKYIEALGLQGQGRHEEAITRFREVLAVKPDMTGALAGIVRSYREQDKTAVAMDEVAAFVTANPTDAQARQLFVAELLRDRADERARAVLEEGLARDAAWIAGYRGLGELALRAGIRRRRWRCTTAGSQPTRRRWTCSCWRPPRSSARAIAMARSCATARCWKACRRPTAQRTTWRCCWPVMAPIRRDSPKPSRSPNASRTPSSRSSPTPMRGSCTSRAILHGQRQCSTGSSNVRPRRRSSATTWARHCFAATICRPRRCICRRRRCWPRRKVSSTGTRTRWRC